jgi:hypothetical protein
MQLWIRVIPLIVNMLGNSATWDMAASALQSLTYDNQKSKEIVFNAGGIPLLVEMIKNGSTGATEKAAIAIFFLVQQQPQHDTTATSIPLLVELITNADESCIIEAIETLGRLANKHQDNKAAILSNDGIIKTIQYLTQKKREEAAEALGYIAGRYLFWQK